MGYFIHYIMSFFLYSVRERDGERLKSIFFLYVLPFQLSALQQLQQVFDIIINIYMQ